MYTNRLYRGDSISSSSLAKLHRSAGLLTKLIDSGNPAYVTRVGLLDAVRSHIKAEDTSEESFQKHSKFFSFSSCRTVAAFYASDKQPDKLIASQDYFETRYIFTLDITKALPIDASRGLYFLEYSCDPTLISGDAPSDIPLMRFKQDSGWSNCEGCNNGQLKHRLLLIDVVAFLTTAPIAAKFEGAIKNAQHDKEWLVMPSDYIPRLYGESARIPRSKIWFAEYYRLSSEPPRDPELFAMKGIIIDDEVDV